MTTGKYFMHIAIIVLELLLFESMLFYAIVGSKPLHRRVYTTCPLEVTFAAAPNQDAQLRDVDYYRVDYTSNVTPEASDDSDFIAKQMIHVPRHAENPYSAYHVTLPAGVLKVRINTHYKKGYEHASSVRLGQWTLNDHEVDRSCVDPYYNTTFNFHGVCYTPRSFMQGYYVEYIVIVVVSLLAFAWFGLWYFQRRRGIESCVKVERVAIGEL